jgi:DNA-binding transcriptional ArsR family regulator
MNFQNLLITNPAGDEMGCAFKAISDERRRAILKILGKNDASAGEIASKFNISQPTVSNHLKILKEAGLIKEQKIKQSRIYSLNKAELRNVIERIEELMKG